MTEELTTSPGLIDRIRHTPMRDVLRGRLTGRLDIKQHIAQSGLPQPARELIQRVVQRTRLRPLEKVDVANELIAHFTDGLESGKTIDQLIESFGDERKAAAADQSGETTQSYNIRASADGPDSRIYRSNCGLCIDRNLFLFGQAIGRVAN